MESVGNLIVGLAILAGLAGIIVPVLPGLWVCWLAILVWALVESSTTGWIVLAVATTLLAVSQIVRFLVPGRRMKEAGVPWRSVVIGAILGSVGFFVIPVVGLFIGFPLGVYLAERTRLGVHGHAWESTVHALKAMGLSILIELGAGLLMAGAWLIGVIWG